MAKVQLRGSKATPVRTPVKKTTRAETKPAPRALNGLSLRQLIKATPPYIRSSAQEVLIKTLKEATTKGGFPAIRATALSTSKRGSYKLHVIGKEEDKLLSKQRHVLVSCSCSNFMYYWEFALHHWGSAVIKYSNGQPAVQTNPSNHPGMCKHLVALGKIIIQRGF